MRLYERFKSLLDGLGFPLKFISLVDQADPQRHPALVAQPEAMTRLTAMPRLQRVQQASIALQQAALQESTMVRHFLMVGATTGELARTQSDDGPDSRAARLWKMLVRRTSPRIRPEQVREQVRIRLSIVQKELCRLDVRATILEDQELLQTFASCLALGTHPSSLEQNHHRS